MKSNIFREYDIRGIVGTELFLEQGYDLARAIATYYQQKHPLNNKVIIGRDGRSHSLPLTNSFIQAFADTGFDVIDVGIVPTPGVYFAVHHLNIPAAIVITASHNPKEYNGVKMWGIWGQQIQTIKKIYEVRAFSQKKSLPSPISSYDILSTYCNYLVNQFADLKALSVNAVIDCGNGTAGTIIPQLISALEWKNVHVLFETVDGTFPHHEADPTVPENMTFVADALQKNKTLTVGFGLDGDCDRMNPMTQSGYLVPGDIMLALYAEQTLSNHPNAAVVCDIKSTSSLLDWIHQAGGRAFIAPSGHSLIKQAMLDHDALLGGELSCHFFFHDRYFGYDDGIYALLRTVELLKQKNMTLEQLVSKIPAKINSPEFRILCKNDAEKVAIVDHVKKLFATKTDIDILTIDGIRAEFDHGWGLLRASNTQPVICLRFESDSKQGLEQVKQDFLQPLTAFFDEQFLKEKIEL